MNRQLIISTLVAIIGVLCASTTAVAAEVRPNLATETKPPEYTYDRGIIGAVKAYGKLRSAPDQVVPDQFEPGGGGGCWGATTTRSRGIYPYNRGLHLYTVWCSNGSVITYRTSSSWPFGDFLCRCTSGPHVDKVAGGAGWSFVDVQAWASYACHSPWWFDWNDTLVMRIRYHPNGWYETIYYQ
jgi:hypothetical protein